MLVFRRVARIFVRPGCQCGCIVRTPDCIMRCQISRDVDSKLLLIATVGSLDPDTGMRVVGEFSVDYLRAYLREHIPQLEHAARIVRPRVCQYENTWNGDFLD